MREKKHNGDMPLKHDGTKPVKHNHDTQKGKIEEAK